MGNRKRVKKRNKNQNQQVEASMSSSSTSMSMSTSMVQSDTTHNEIEGEHSSKKINRGEDLSNFGPEAGPSQSRSRGQGQWSNVETVSMDNLPPEMLTQILKCVDTRRLLVCRLVNRTWCRISTEILTTRRDCKVAFSCFGKNKCRPHAQTTKLQDFVKCMKKSKKCPYSRFSLFFELSFFNNREWTEFLSNCSNKKDSSNPNQNQHQKQKIRIKYLKLANWETPALPTREFYLRLTEKVRNLLLHEIPNLEEFRFNCFSQYCGLDTRSLKLFPPSQNPEMKPKTPETTPVPVQLPHLKILSFHLSELQNAPGIVRDLLNAAVNLKNLIVTNVDELCNGFAVLGMFHFLHSRGKLSLLQSTDIFITTEFLSAWNRMKTRTQTKTKSKTETEQPDFSLAFKLHELKLHTDNILQDPSCLAFASHFVSNLLESSKNTLRKLELTRIGFLPGLQLPKFPKLTTLTLSEMIDYLRRDRDFQEPVFPPETRLEQVFPAVRDLGFYLKNADNIVPQEDSNARLPSVKTLRLIYSRIKAEIFPLLTVMCPNLKKLQVQRGNLSDQRINRDCEHLLKVGRWIWTHMTQLESLELDLVLNWTDDCSSALDSFFTGISIENCQRLHALKEAEKISKLQPPEKTFKEEMERMTVREHPSILDMKDLRRLSVNLYAGAKLLGKKDPHTEKWTCVSQEYAFKLMPLLKINED